MIRNWVGGDGTESGGIDIKLEVRKDYMRRVKYVRSLEKIPNILVRLDHLCQVDVAELTEQIGGDECRPHSENKSANHHPKSHTGPFRFVATSSVASESIERFTTAGRARLHAPPVAVGTR